MSSATSALMTFHSKPIAPKSTVNTLTMATVMGAPAAMSVKLLLILMTFAVVGFGLGLPRYLAASRKPDVWGRR